MLHHNRAQLLSLNWRDGIFKDKVLFCTGGAGDICSAQVKAMVFLGANACIIGRSIEKTERMAKVLAGARPAARVLGLGGVDVRDYASLAAAVDRCVRELGSIDFVIAGAAGNFLAPISDLSPNAFKAVIDIDLIGSYNTLKATLPHLEKSAAKFRDEGTGTPPHGTGGRIIFISATLQYRGTAQQTHGAAAKAGVDTISSGAAIELGPRGITSNILAPGAVAGTEGMKRLAELGDLTDSAKSIPLCRMATTKEINDATVFLFADTGSYINGATVVVDGGSWRITGVNDSNSFPYPQYLLSRKIEERPAKVSRL